MLTAPFHFAARVLALMGLTGLTCAAGESAADDALRAGRALCKVLSRNDAGIPGSHQSGLYLPKAAGRFFSSTAPVEEENHREEVTVKWSEEMQRRFPR